MRISQIMLGKGFGGAERSFVDTTLALAGRGHDVLAICHKAFTEIEQLRDVERVTVQTVSAMGEWDFLVPLKIAKLLREFGAEVVHTQLKRAAWHGGRAAAKESIPVVAKLHNYVQLDRYKNVTWLIGTTEDQRRYAVDSGWPADRVSVIPNFSRIRPVEAISTSRNAPVAFLSYGRYVKKKGFDILLEAFAQVVRHGYDVTLKIGGQGIEYDNLSKLGDALEISDRVSLGVWLSDVSGALDASECFVVSSRDEPFGIVMLEAMARGVPIITTKTKGPSAVLKSDMALFAETGSVESLAEQMMHFLEDRNTAVERANAALTLYKSHYQESAVLPKIEAIYQELSHRGSVEGVGN